jgi:DNA-binding PadR family transcriptional regulator
LPRPFRRDSDQPLKPAAFLLLVSLAAGDRHGYALRREVAERSRGAIKLGPASLYRTIGTLLQDRLIEESERRPAPELDDERRRYYRITEKGRQALRAETHRLEQLAAAARAVIPVRTKS